MGMRFGPVGGVTTVRLTLGPENEVGASEEATLLSFVC